MIDVFFMTAQLLFYCCVIEWQASHDVVWKKQLAVFRVKVLLPKNNKNQ